MSRRGDADAARRYCDAPQRTVSCVTRAILAREHSAAETSGSLRFPDRLVRIRGDQAVDLWFLHFFDLASPDRGPARSAARTSGYSYQIYDPGGSELIAWHWHPSKPELPTFPHLHVTASASATRIERKHHVPTGFVSAPSVIRFAIADLGIRPLRPDWERVLDETELVVGWATQPV